MPIAAPQPEENTADPESAPTAKLENEPTTEPNLPPWRVDKPHYLRALTEVVAVPDRPNLSAQPCRIAHSPSRKLDNNALKFNNELVLNRRQKRR
jgi:hypothetical protein